MNSIRRAALQWLWISNWRTRTGLFISVFSAIGRVRQGNHRPQTPPRCCQLGSYFKRRKTSPVRPSVGLQRPSLATRTWRWWWWWWRVLNAGRADRPIHVQRVTCSWWPAGRRRLRGLCGESRTWSWTQTRTWCVRTARCAYTPYKHARTHVNTR